MTANRLHYFSCLVLMVVTGLLLFNQLYALGGAAGHLQVMKTLRLLYPSVVQEAL